MTPSHHSAVPASTVAAAKQHEPLTPQVYWTVAEGLDNAAVAALMVELSADETEQARRFRFDRDRATYVAAHVMLRRVLRERLGGAEPRIGAHPLGRPELASDPEGVRGPIISFNLTHSAGFAACAVLGEAPVGIDAEDIRRPLDIAPMAARWYAAAERRLLDRMAEPHRTEMFFRIWTLKEAILKAAGLGLRVEPQRFAVDPDRLQANLPDGLGIPTRWRLAELVPLPHIRLALAVPGQGRLAPSATRLELI